MTHVVLQLVFSGYPVIVSMQLHTTTPKTLCTEMKILAIIAHPRSDSFCHSIFNTAKSVLAESGHDLVVHDLYEESFDPVLKAQESYTAGESAEVALLKSTDPLVLAHRRDISEADGLLVVHPNWWGKPPAILAGWLDRVLVPGVAYRLEAAEGEPEGLLSLKRVVIFNTSDTPPDREREVLGDPLNLIWNNCVIPFCGSPKIERQMYGPVACSTQETRSEWIENAKQILTRSFG